MTLDRDALVRLCAMTDEMGVLSIYACAEPAEQASTRPAWEVRVRNALRDLRERVRAEGPRARWAALVARLDALEPDLRTLLHPREPGVGRALFVAVGGGETRTVVTQLPVPDRVVLEPTPYVRPLVAVLAAGRPVGSPWWGATRSGRSTGASASSRRRGRSGSRARARSGAR